MTAPDPGLTDLIAAHTLRVVELNEAARYPECNGCDWIGGLVKDHAVHLAELLTATYAITPKLIAKPGIPCGDWADGHSYRKCSRPKGHEGHHG